MYSFETTRRIAVMFGYQTVKILLHISGKGVNIWDTLTHDCSHLVVDRSNGDVADDSYHLYMEDVKLLKDMGVSPWEFISQTVKLETLHLFLCPKFRYCVRRNLLTVIILSHMNTIHTLKH
jgi:hypothetical protein